MISLREDMGQPDNAQCSHAQSFAMTVGGNVLVQHFCYLHVLHVADQQGDVIYAFCFYVQGFFHAFSLPESCDCVHI